MPAFARMGLTSMVVGTLILTGCSQHRNLISEAPPIRVTTVAESDAAGEPRLLPPENPPVEGIQGQLAETLFATDRSQAERRATASPPVVEEGPVPGTLEEPAPPPGPAVWGIVGMRGFPYGDHVASNGVEFTPIFSLDLDFNVWLWRQQGIYLYGDTRFWGQKAAPGITNPSQGAFDFSKREFDLTAGAAWNYYDSWEARVFAYSYNNLNRGNSAISPAGFNDGVGVENRYYLGSTYADLGTADFDLARATFVSLGYYPSKSMVNGVSQEFTPGLFAHAYLTWEIFGPRCYLFTDDQIILDRSFTPTLFLTDTGVAVRPFDRVPRLEFRVGTEDTIDLHGSSDPEVSAYVSIRYVF